MLDQGISHIIDKQIILAILILEVTGASVDSETSTGTVICTPLFAAPEAHCHAEVNSVYVMFPHKQSLFSCSMYGTRENNLNNVFISEKTGIKLLLVLFQTYTSVKNVLKQLFKVL